jgi:2-phospho-L-lactate/phosphoenolpyruvate guanylyltransferase
MGTVAVLPIKTFARAKHRLSDAVGEPDRRELAEAMAADVLAALAAVAGLDAVVAVTAEPRAAAAARAAGARVVHDDREAGQSAAAMLGVEAAVALGAERVLLVPGDCPALDPAEVGALLAGAPAEVVIVSDRHGSGTNALLLSPPGAIEPSFGDGSLARHAARGRAAGASVRIVDVPSLSLDVDTPGDLDALRSALAAREGGAARTRALLARLLPAAAAAG